MKSTNKISLFSTIAAVFIMTMGIFAFTPAPSHNDTKKGEKVTLTGEVLDLHCYMAGEKHGADHAQCAAMCIKGGAPIGLLTSDNKVYLLTEDHGNPDPYNSLKKEAAKTVTVTGTKFERGGLTGVMVSEVKEK